MTALPLTLALSGAGLVLTVIFGILLTVAAVATLFPAVRRSNALFAPCLVLLTLAGTGVVLAALLMIMHRMS